MSAGMLLGVRLSVAGGRASRLRLALITGGVGLGVAMLLLVAAVPTASAAREQRRADRSSDVAVQSAGPDTLLVLTVSSRFGDETVRGRLLRPDGDRAPVPPGLTRLPAAGEMVVSPALAAMLDGPGGEVLRERWSTRVAGMIAPAGLSGPEEVFFYAGSDTITTDGDAMRIKSFGSAGPPTAADPLLVVLAVVGLVIMLVPVLVFVMASVRFGSESRERRLAAIRLVGADRRMIRRIAAGESLAGAVLGLPVGGALFLALRSVVGGLLPADFAPYPSDLSPAPTLIALIVLLVPAGAMMVTVAALRQVIVEPLGTVRRSTVRRRRLWWRLIAPAVGVALLYPLTGGLSDLDVDTQRQLAAGAVLLLAGLVLLLPWTIQAVVRPLGGGSVAWLLGVRRLQQNSDAAVRSVSGIAVSVAGIIAIQGLLGASVAANIQDQPPKERFQVGVHRAGTGGAGLLRDLAGTPGVREVRASGYASLRQGTQDQTAASVRVGECEVLRQFAALPSCTDGASFVATREGWDGRRLTAGEELAVHSGDAAAPVSRWTVPAGMPAARMYAGSIPVDYLATPGALRIDPSLRGMDVDSYLVALDPTAPDALERVRNTVARLAPSATVQVYGDDQMAGQFLGAQRFVQSCAVLLLLFVGAGMLVTIVEQLRERRRQLAVLVAFGTPLRVLAASVFYQAALPAAVGLLLAVIVGGGMSAQLLSVTGAPAVVDPAAIAGIVAVAAAMVVGITAAGLPLLARLTAVTELRSE